jgi:hypothetical protein
MTMAIFLALALQGPLPADSPARGTVTIEYAADDTTPAAIRGPFAEAIEQAFARAGFTALPAPGRGFVPSTLAVTSPSACPPANSNCANLPRPNSTST